MRNGIKIILTALLIGAVTAPLNSAAEKVDSELVDRVYRKYQEREERKKAEREQKQNEQVQRDQSKREQAQREENRNQRDYSRESDRRNNGDNERSRSDAGSLFEDLARMRSRETSDREDDRSSRRSHSNSRTTQDTEQPVRDKVTLDQAVNMIRDRTNGKVISAKTTGSGARKQHKIKVLIDGSRVRTFIVSASSGEIY